MRAPVEILGRRFPSYELVLIAAGPVVLGLLWLLLNKTRFGVLVRAATQDREMVGALGVNQALLFTGTLFLGAFLAGLGGALQIPKAPAIARMDLDIIAETFVVTVIGGMGSIPGAFLAALVIGQLQRLRHPGLPEDHARARVPAHGASCSCCAPTVFSAGPRRRPAPMSPRSAAGCGRGARPRRRSRSRRLSS